MNQDKPNPMIVCDLCGRSFKLNPNILGEREILLHKESQEPHTVTLTSLTCPICGKEYPVVMDDETTLPILERMRSIMHKQVRQAKKGFPPNAKLAEKRRQLNWKLDFKRQKLVEKYNGSFYQLEDGTMVQLDYRYRSR